MVYVVLFHADWFDGYYLNSETKPYNLSTAILKTCTQHVPGGETGFWRFTKRDWCQWLKTRGTKCSN